MLTRCACWFACLLLGSVSTLVYAQVWKHVDEHGVIHFTNQPHPRGQLVMGGATPAARLGLVDDDMRQARRAVAMVTRKPAYKDLAPLMSVSAESAGVDHKLVKAVIMAESGFDSTAVSRKGAVGLMQVMPATAQRYGLASDVQGPITRQLKQPDVNLRVGTRYLADLMRLYPDRLDLVLAAYNAGEGAVNRAGWRIPDYPETQIYVRKVLALYQVLMQSGQG